MSVVRDAEIMAWVQSWDARADELTDKNRGYDDLGPASLIIKTLRRCAADIRSALQPCSECAAEHCEPNDPQVNCSRACCSSCQRSRDTRTAEDVSDAWQDGYDKGYNAALFRWIDGSNQ